MSSKTKKNWVRLVIEILLVVAAFISGSSEKGKEVISSIINF